MNTYKSLLSVGNYCLYNKQLAEKIGKNEALLFGFFCYLAERSENGWFCYTYADMMDDLCISSENTIRKLVGRLENKDLIVRHKEKDNTVYYAVNQAELKSILANFGISSIDLLASSSYQIYNRAIAHVLGGTDEAIVYAILASYSQRYSDDDGWFTVTEEKLAKDMGLSRLTVINVIKHIEEKKVINTKREGIPSRKYYRFNIKKVKDLIEKIENVPSLKIFTTSCKNLPHPLPQNLYNYNNINVTTSLHSVVTDTFSSDEDKTCEKNTSEIIENSDDIFTDLLDETSYPTKELKYVSELIKKGGFNHRIPTNGSAPSKTIQKCISLIQEIASGKFLKWNLDPEWAENNSDPDQLRKVSDEIFNFKDAVDLIDSVLDDFNKAREPGYYPRDKKVLPKSFADFLYNEHTGKSWFIHFLVKGYQPLEEVDNAKYVEALPVEFTHMLDNEGIHWEKYFSRIARTVCDMADWHQRTRNRLDRHTDYSWLFHKEDFWQSYINYVYDLVGDEGHPSKGHFMPYGKTHQAWMAEMSSEYEIDWSSLAKMKGEKERGYNAI